MSADQVTWVMIGACTPPVARRWSPNSVPMSAPAMVKAGLRVAAVTAVYAAVALATGWRSPTAVYSAPRKKSS